MHHFGELIGEDLFRAVELAAHPRFHLRDLIEREEGEELDALEHIRIVDIAPVLVEVEGGGLVRVEPDRVAGCLAHLVALRVGQQRDRHGGSVLAELAADQLGAAEHVAPLVVAAELQIAAVFLVERVEIVALHNHVVKLEEGEALFHALLVAFRAQHVVDREARAHFAQQLDVVEL